MPEGYSLYMQHLVSCTGFRSSSITLRCKFDIPYEYDEEREGNNTNVALSMMYICLMSRNSKSGVATLDDTQNLVGDRPLLFSYSYLIGLLCPHLLPHMLCRSGRSNNRYNLMS